MGVLDSADEVDWVAFLDEMGCDGGQREDMAWSGGGGAED